jgi:D-alanyl-D-alanine carboxypeptidase
MKRLHFFSFTFVSVAAIITLSFFIGSTHEVFTYEDPRLSVEPFSLEGVSAEALEVVDMETGVMLASKNEHEVKPIASVTKLVTAALTLLEANIDTQNSVTYADTTAEGRAGKLAGGDKYSGRALLFPLLLESSNDAGAVLARLHPQLLERMNAFVRSKGLTTIAFGDTTGLSAQNVATAHELSNLLQVLYREHVHLFDITTLSQSIGEHTGWRNNNPVASLPGYKGGKHGFTEASGRTLVAVFEETLKSGEEVTVGYTLLHSEDLKTDIELLRKEVARNVYFK